MANLSQTRWQKWPEMTDNQTDEPESPALERRPLETRSKSWAILLAKKLSHHVTPNQISCLGMIGGIIAGGVLAATRYESFYSWGFILGAGLIQFRLLCNMLDGMVAVNRNECSPLGELYNEIPDRVSDTAILVGAGYAATGNVLLGFLVALMAMFLAYVRAMGKNAGAHQEFCGPMGKPHRMFTMTVTALYAGLAPENWQPAFFGSDQPATVTWGLLVIFTGSLPTLYRRLSRIVTALNHNNQQGINHG